MDQEWARDLDAWFPHRDASYVPIWGASWSDFSGCGWMVILDHEGQLFVLEGGSNPQIQQDEPIWLPEPVSEQQALALLGEWEEFLDG